VDPTLLDAPLPSAEALSGWWNPLPLPATEPGVVCGLGAA
jgi:hypothetical protein